MTLFYYSITTELHLLATSPTQYIDAHCFFTLYDFILPSILSIWHYSIGYYKSKISQSYWLYTYYIIGDSYLVIMKMVYKQNIYPNNVNFMIVFIIILVLIIEDSEDDDTE